MKKPSLHIILFAVIMTVLCLPLVQHVGNIFHIRKVDGFTAPVEPVKLSLETYRNQTYQEYVRTVPIMIPLIPLYSVKNWKAFVA